MCVLESFRHKRGKSLAQDNTNGAKNEGSWTDAVAHV